MIMRALLSGYSPSAIVFSAEDRYLDNKFDIPNSKENRIDPKEIQELRKRIPEILKQNYEKHRSYHDKKFKDLKVKVGNQIVIEKTFKKKTDTAFVGQKRNHAIFS